MDRRTRKGSRPSTKTARPPVTSETTKAPTPIRSAPPRASLNALLTSLVVVLGVHLGAFKIPFIFDDHIFIEGSPAVQELHPFEYFTRTFVPESNTGASVAAQYYYRPIVTLSYAVDWKLHDGTPDGFHLANLAAHVVSCALLFALARRAGASTIASALASTAWGLAPRLTESVDWISGRTDVFAAVFVFAALLVWRGDDRKRRWCGGGLIFLGLLCKEVAAAGVVAIAVREWFDAHQATPRRPVGEVLGRLVPFAVVLPIYFWLRLSSGTAFAGQDAPPPFSWTV